MATVTVGSIIDRAIRKADMLNSGYIQPAEAMDLFNEAWGSLYDIMVAANEDYFSTDYLFSITNATDTYALPADFYKGIGTDFKIGTSGTGYTTLRRFDQNERNQFFGGVFSSIPAGQIRLRYVPLPTLYTATTDTVQVMANWDVYLTVYMARMMLLKEESNVSPLEQQLEQLERRMVEMSQNRDMGMPGRVTDMALIDFTPVWSNLRYDFLGSNIVFLSREIVDLSYWAY